MPKTTKCEDCGKRVQTALGSDPRYPQGVRTESGTYICGPLHGKSAMPDAAA